MTVDSIIIDGINVNFLGFDDKKLINLINVKIEEYINIILKNYSAKNDVVKSICVYREVNNIFVDCCGKFYHNKKTIHILFDKDNFKIENEIYFVETLIHELMHGIFEVEINKDEVSKEYYHKYAVIDFINEYRAYNYSYSQMLERYSKDNYLGKLYRYRDYTYNKCDKYNINDLIDNNSKKKDRIINAYGEYLAISEILYRHGQDILPIHEKILKKINSIDYTISFDNIVEIDKLLIQWISR